MTQAIAWYDRLAPRYDLLTLGDAFYREKRGEAVAALNLEPGQTVLDLFCGTGLAWPHLARALAGTGQIVAVDGSAPMLAKAQRKARRLPGGIAVQPRQIDLAAQSGRRELGRVIAARPPAGVLIGLGLTLLGSYTAVVDTVLDAVPAGTRIAVLDLYGPTEDLGKRLADWLAAADTARPVWEPLEAQAANFTLDRRALAPLISDLELVVAAGRKG